VKQRCLNLLALDAEKAPAGNNELPFDLTRAHQLYQALFGQVEDLIKDKHLLIVPSSSLTQIPFHVLVTEQPDPAATGAEAFRRAVWLTKSNPITVLPSVSSLTVRLCANTPGPAMPPNRSRASATRCSTVVTRTMACAWSWRVPESIAWRHHCHA